MTGAGIFESPIPKGSIGGCISTVSAFTAGPSALATRKSCALRHNAPRPRKMNMHSNLLYIKAKTEQILCPTTFSALPCGQIPAGYQRFCLTLRANTRRVPHFSPYPAGGELAARTEGLQQRKPTRKHTLPAQKDSRVLYCPLLEKHKTVEKETWNVSSCI